MNTKLIAWIAGVIVIGTFVIGAVWYSASTPSTAPKPVETTQSGTTLPTSGSITAVTGTSDASSAKPGMTLAAQDGSNVVVTDFIHNGVTIADTVNADHYLLAGNLGYCFATPEKCQAAPATNFVVYYNSVPQSFTIDLTGEPLGQARLAMEQFMQTTLGITEQQMCTLNYLVSVTKYVNAQFAGKNLGFSFCPGATVLPK